MKNATKMFGAFKVVLSVGPMGFFTDDADCSWDYRAELFDENGNFVRSFYDGDLKNLLLRVESEAKSHEYAAREARDLTYLLHDGWCIEYEDAEQQQQRWSLQMIERVPNDLKIKAIKLVRQFTGMGLKEAKDYVEGSTYMPTDCRITDLDTDKPLTKSKIIKAFDNEDLWCYFAVL